MIIFLESLLKKEGSSFGFLPGSPRINLGLRHLLIYTKVDSDVVEINRLLWRKSHKMTEFYKSETTEIV